MENVTGTKAEVRKYPKLKEKNILHTEQNEIRKESTLAESENFCT